MSWVDLCIPVVTNPKRVGFETELVKLNSAMVAGMLFVPA